MTTRAIRYLSVSLGLLSAAGLRAQYAEPFDAQATADITILQQPDNVVSFVDYSNMTIGAASFSLPEAPRQIAGSLPTRGVLIQANVTQTVASGVNILAGATPITFAGRYRLSFDAYINVPFPLPGGSTEQVLWGVGVDGGATALEVRNNRGAGTIGVWGWLAGENGYSTEDAVINTGDLELADLGDTQPGEGVPFNEAFDSNTVGGPNGAAANSWVRMDIDVDVTGTRVYINGVEFFNDPTAPVPGFAMIGYEDPFNSLGSDPDAQWALLDNFRVTLPAGCGALGTAVAQGTSAGGEILNGGAPPAVASPLTVRLRGGMPNSVAFIAAGFPSPVSIPVALGANCTVNFELASLDILLDVATDANGGALFTFDVPNNPGLCGFQLGWQWMTLDLANQACPFVLTDGLAMTIGS
ncbi:MAG: hypothetical protein AB8H80_09355 [Planctomycetota bacterium]